MMYYSADCCHSAFIIKFKLVCSRAKCSVVCGDVVKHKLNVSLLLIIVVLHLQNVFLQK